MRRLCIMRKDLEMSPGKLSAMVGHAFEIYWMKRLQENPQPVRRWVKMKLGEFTEGAAMDTVAYSARIELDVQTWEDYVNGSITKTVCEAKNKKQLLKAKNLAEELGLVEDKDFGFIRDLCLTELEPEDEDGRTTVGMWFKPLSDEIAHQISKKYQLYK